MSRFQKEVYRSESSPQPAELETGVELRIIEAALPEVLAPEDQELLERARGLRRFMASSIKEVGLQAYCSGKLLSDIFVGMTIMATKVCRHLEIEDQEISDLLLEAYNVDLARIRKTYAFPPAFAATTKEK